MELRRVEALLLQSECGAYIADNMSISEPILTKGASGLIDHFFVYYTAKEPRRFSAPIARMGINAETEAVEYMVSCEKEPLYFQPGTVIAAQRPHFDEAAYREYAKVYPKLREIAFHTLTTQAQKDVVRQYHALLERVIDPALMPAYRELAPSFFEWMKLYI